jgi:hypothetical protein
MIKFILKLIFGDYNHRIARSMSAFTKIIEKCQKLNEEMHSDIQKKNEKINDPWWSTVCSAGNKGCS